MDMQRRWRFKPHFVPHPIDEQRVLLLTERQEHQVLNGRLYARLAPLLDGSRTGYEAVALLDGHVPTEKAYFALMTLQRRGYLSPADIPIPLDQAAFWYGLGVDAEEAVARVQTTPVAVVEQGVAADDAGTLAVALAAAGVAVVDEADAAFAIVATSDYGDPGVAALACRFRDRSLPWALIRPAERIVWIGPVFPAGKGCIDCLAHTIHEHTLTTADVPGAASSPIGHALAVTEVTTWIGCGGTAPSTLLTYDAVSMITRRFPVHRHPACSTCA